MQTERVDPSKDFPIVSWGLPFPEACVKHMSDTLHTSKAYIIVSGSLSRNTDALQRLESALGGDRVVGVRKGMTPHTLYSELLTVAEDVKRSGADCIVTLGGGSLIDGAKGMVFVSQAIHILSSDRNSRSADYYIEGFDIFLKKSVQLRLDRLADPNTPTELKPAVMPVISITTTLSAGEYNPAGGATNDNTRHKQLFQPPASPGPKVIIWDPELTLTVPEKVWLSTGLRAVDHCVETICSSNPKPKGTVYSTKGLRLLIPALLRTKQDPADLDARLNAQKGGAESMKAHLLEGVHAGGSHGIGHQLGPYGVPHAETTCVLLPAVQKFNARVNAAQQAELVTILWDDPIVASVLEKHSLTREIGDLGDVLDAIIRELGFPRTLKEYGIGRENLDKVAESSLGDICCTWNAISLVKKEQVLEILEMCVGDE
ncbi:Dehydrogenase [Lachnellula subtilissima]|uniref:Dehydrogenase n=1 Tax=Lachnellula subtilissima TaxID=602034 RepID=A0A8H8U6A3_9HELO|nr:Dehydrogenase [Lachnellula subtilissima]